MLILGLNGGFSTEDVDLVPGLSEHFFYAASACLVRDGVTIAAVEEERLNRIKNTTKFPINAIRSCIDHAKISPADIDAIGFYYREDYMDSALHALKIENPTLSLDTSRAIIKNLLADQFNWSISDTQLVYVPHHLSHAVSTYSRSDIAEALVVVFDGTGEEESGTVYRATTDGFVTLATYPVSDSLGWLYLRGTQLLGYHLGDEYKLMGLAPYGNPETYRHIFDSLYNLHDKGMYSLNLHPRLVDYNLLTTEFFRHGFSPRRKGDPFTQEHMDFAAGLQETLERIVLHVLAYWSENTGIKSLCFTGGVAHNSTLNGRILRSGIFDKVFVHPASHDAGAAEGAALYTERTLTGAAVHGAPLRNANLGPDLGDESATVNTLRSWGHLIRHRKLDDIIGTTASLLANGNVIGWAQGGSEFGPRALGNRSILADPRPHENQDRINKMIKRRESYRPFAPVVTAEAAPRYFDLASTEADYGFMSFVVPVKEDYRQELGAVTHVDNTARLQIITPTANERFYNLVERFGELTGTPVLLNTSFNNNAEPIVQNLNDALTTYLTTGLDYLIVNDYLVDRKVPASIPDLCKLAVSFRPTTRLSKRSRLLLSGTRETLHEIYLDHRFGSHTTISSALYTLLAEADGTQAVDTLAKLTGIAFDDKLNDELFELWRERLLILSPPDS